MTAAFHRADHTRFTYLFCSVCGRKMGKKTGVQVVQGLICDDPICNFQEPPTIHAARDGLIIAAALNNVPISRIAENSGMSRQRVYQILTEWKQGV